MWHTIAPDGRSLIVRRTSDGWLATCGPNRIAAASPEDAIRGALGPLAKRGKATPPVEQWIKDHLEALVESGDEPEDAPATAGDG